MIMRSLVHRRLRLCAARRSTPEPCSGAEAQGRLPRLRPGQTPGSARRAVSGAREQAGRATQSNNYWSSTTYQNNPDNAWNVNFNDGNVNANNKSNNNYVRAVRGGSWSVDSPRRCYAAGRGPEAGAAGGTQLPAAARR